jgi:hypothetical protein
MMDVACWCGASPERVTQDGRKWCLTHAPRCRSGAHFYGNCQCTGCGCPTRGHGRGSACRADRLGLKYTSDDWCGCKCHELNPTEAERQ